jgi:predicted O-linked N-acetylglucosamine transferase (SPINDLY family)
LQIEPDSIEINKNIANAYINKGEIKQSIYSYRRLLELDKDNPEGNANLAVGLVFEHEYATALEHIKKALIFDSNNPVYLQIYSSIKYHLSDFSFVFKPPTKSENIEPKKNNYLWGSYLFGLIYHPDLSADEIRNEHMRWGSLYENMPIKNYTRPYSGQPIRIGYVSPDFKNHSCKYYYDPLFSNHDKNKFEIVAYSNVQKEDDDTQRFKGYFSAWRDISGLSDEDAADLIASDEIDILVDGCGHMRDNRLGVFAFRPARIQVTWLGAAWTTGLPQMDYSIFDPFMAPEGTCSSEEILLLPSTWTAFRPGEKAINTIVSELPAIKNGYITFGYSGRTERLNYKVFKIWAKILKTIPSARIIIDFSIFKNTKNKEYYSEIFKKYELDLARVEMRCSSNIFQGLQDFDILLDSFPHSGGTMLFDAVWMGVPIITLASRPPVGRIGASLMTNIGLEDWVANTEEEYVEKCIFFSQSTQHLASLRKDLRGKLLKSPIMDEQKFARDMEYCYTKILNYLPSDSESKKSKLINKLSNEKEIENPKKDNYLKDKMIDKFIGRAQASKDAMAN